MLIHQKSNTWLRGEVASQRSMGAREDPVAVGLRDVCPLL